ncbi:hypothetical protein N7491_007264 [Penicillium cf. griseofulvum]|uniref:WD repeat protein n=1 Tax=Penicillium cf. griseofulvum TaxID=2972120 RepID=A0A9W9M0S9_9EURO|nr:hypothetical protein N7472_009708 [Penicillium cf. griseofulvum]KAJ5430248.1 hypothetical protein N7491_007264 [Penicillium cf. griseofulvum]
MSLSLEHIDAFLPITALKTFVLGDRRFVFQSQGTIFRVVDESTGVVSTQIQIFKRNNIHGFITLDQRPQDHDPRHVQIIVWGGRSVRAVNFFVDFENEVTMSASSAEFTAPDWIMSGCAAAAGGHYGAFFITANNALLSLELLNSERPEINTTISIYQLATSVKSILYSADVIALSSSHVLIAAGTVFGEIIVWSCFLNENGSHKANTVGSIHHFFTGHDGSIFDVRISPQIPSLNGGQSGRILASCSDDRTVRIWDISDCEHKTAQDPSAYSTDGFELRSTGFGPVEAGEESVGSESCVVQAFAHAARIWGVHFRPIKNNNQTHMGLVSRGEDCTCVLWDLSWHLSSGGTTDYRLSQTSSIQTHIGKHIWSLDLCRIGSETVVYTGGADGALKSFPIKENDDEHLNYGVDASLQQSSKKKKHHTGDGARSFAFVAQDCLLRISTQGQIQLGYLSQTEETVATWETICETPELASFAVMTTLPQMGLALIGNSQGFFRLYNHATKSVINIADVGNRPLASFFLQTHSSKMDTVNPSSNLTFLVCYPTGEEITLVTISDWNSDHSNAETTTFTLPSTFVVCSASFVFDDQYLIIGSKLGGLAIYNTSEAEPVLVIRRVHGREFVNHISVVTSVTSSDTTRSDFVLTCGRDGTYCLHELQLCGNGIDAVSLQTVHRTASITGGNIEGAYFDKATGDFMLYGFRSQDFILRNESKLTDVVSIASGGFRRAWDFIPGDKNNNALFTWKDGFTLMTTRIRAGASTLLRAGGHGREIKAVDVFNPIGGDRPLFATGAEDTTVRIFTPTSSLADSPWGSFECLRVLDTHKSGIQQVTWSKDGRYLFTSAAYEEFYVWRVRTIPVFGVATKLMAVSPKDDENSDLRIPSFDLLEVEEVDGEQGFLLCLALSNSVFKIFHFSPSNGQFTLLARGKYMTNCLTQAHFLVTSSSVSLITAATDGYFTLWDLTSTLNPFYTITQSTLKAKHPFKGSSISPQHITCESRYQIHSNSIKGMELVPISDSATAVVAGGDDNSLSVSLLRTNLSDTGTNAQVATVSIPDAHVAAVTTVKVLSQQISRDVTSNKESIKITVASSGNDHRVKIWSIAVDPTQPGTQGIVVEFLLDAYSSVADVSSLGLVHGHGNCLPAERCVPGSEMNQSRLVVCGVGMEMFAAESDKALPT